jgi:hypothetical protein
MGNAQEHLNHLDGLLAVMQEVNQTSRTDITPLIRASTPPDQLKRVLAVLEEKWGHLATLDTNVAPSLVTRLGGVKFARLLEGGVGYRLRGANGVLDGADGDLERCIDVLGGGSGLSTLSVCDLMELHGPGDNAWPSRVVRCLDNFDGGYWFFYLFSRIVKAWPAAMRTDANCDRAVYFCKEMGCDWLDVAFLDKEYGNIDPDAIGPSATMLSAATTSEASIRKWIRDVVFAMHHGFAENELFTKSKWGSMQLNKAACPKRNRMFSMLDGDLDSDGYDDGYHEDGRDDHYYSWPSLAQAIWNDEDDWDRTITKFPACHARVIHQRLVNHAVVAGNADALKVILSATPPPGPAPLSPAVIHETATFAHYRGMHEVVQALHLPYLRFEVLMRGIQNTTTSKCRLYRIAGISGVQQHLIEFCDFFELEEACSVQ